MNTPWGNSDYQKTIAPGIVEVGTPSHGGIWLSPERVAQLPLGIDNFLHDLRWWEEDCDWCIPYVIFADDIRAHGQAYKFESNLLIARETLERWHPEILNKIKEGAGIEISELKGHTIKQAMKFIKSNPELIQAMLS